MYTYIWLWPILLFCWWIAFGARIHRKLALGMLGHNGPQLRRWTRKVFPRLGSAQTLSHWKAVGVRLKPNSNLRKRIWQRPCCIRNYKWLKDLHIVHLAPFAWRGSSNPTLRRHMAYDRSQWLHQSNLIAFDYNNQNEVDDQVILHVYKYTHTQ